VEPLDRSLAVLPIGNGTPASSTSRSNAPWLTFTRNLTTTPERSWGRTSVSGDVNRAVPRDIGRLDGNVIGSKERKSGTSSRPEESLLPTSRFSCTLALAFLVIVALAEATVRPVLLTIDYYWGSLHAQGTHGQPLKLCELALFISALAPGVA
jgi:hypothetical protein